jgi:diguanylate cyclase (GGDEF)-like protein
MLGKRIFRCLTALSWALVLVLPCMATVPEVSLPPSARLAVEHFGDRFGLSAMTVTSLAQDRQGFLWIGTQSGLLRYDGSRVRKFDEVERITSHYIDQLLIAPDGTLWVKGGDGIAHLVNDHFVPLPIPKEAGAIVEGFQFLAVDRSHKVYVTTENGVLRINAANPSQYHLYKIKDGLPGPVAAVTLAPDDSVWSVTGNRLARFEAGTSSFQVQAITGIPDDRVVGLQFDGSGTLWLRTVRHLARLDPGSRKMVLDDRGIPPANVDGLPSVDQSGDLLVPTLGGLFHRAGRTWQVITDQQGLSSNSVITALEDREGILWVAGMGAGLDRIIGIKQWSAWTKNEGLPDWLVWSELRDQQGRLWVGTNNGLALWDGSRWRTFQEKDGLAGPEIQQLALAGDGSLWAFSRTAGLTRIDPHTFRMTRLRSLADSGVPAFREMKDSRFFYIKAAPDGDVWASGRDFLVRFDSHAAGFKPAPVKMLPEMSGHVWVLSFSRSGVLWASGAWGVARLQGSQWRVFKTSDGLLAEPSVVLAGGDDDVWVSYNQVPGVSHLRINRDGSLRLDQYPLDVWIMGKDSQGQIWCGGIDGLSVIAADGSTRNINHSDGLIWDDTSPMGFWEEKDGSILIGTSRGLAHYQPRPQSSSVSALNVALTSVSLGDADRTDDHHPVVDYDQATLSVEFTPLTLRNPDKVECRYRLAGLENHFTTSLQREIRYGRLPAGEYALMVQCREGASDWSARSAAFSFEVRPPWWQTWWSRLLGILMVAAIFRGGVLLRTRSIDARRKQLEAAVAERSAELVKKNLELQEISLTDPLTRTRNRRYFYETIAADVSQVGRAYQRAYDQGNFLAEHRDLVFIMVDLDYFKSVNDKLGHSSGDRLLQEVAGRLYTAMRRSDELVRWGGEEFLIICRSTERLQVPALCARILEIIADEPFDMGNANDVWMTCSIGWAPFPWLRDHVDALSVEEVITMADKAMYCAKRFGRNQSVGLLASDEAIKYPEKISLDAIGEASESPLVKVVRTEISTPPEVWNP